MPSTVIDPIDWKTITERIRKGLCVPFLGAAANATNEEEKYKYEGLPLGGDLALRMIGTITELDIEEIESDLKDLNNIGVVKRLLQYPDYKGLARVALQDLTRVALLVRYKTDFDIFINLLKEFIPDNKRQPSLLLKTLASIPKFGLIVTTNYDRLMERALQEAGEHLEVIVQRVRGFSEEEQEEVREQMAKRGARVVYKMHGTFVEDEVLEGDKQSGVDKKPETSREADVGNEVKDVRGDLASQLIISEDDYIQFLTVIGQAKVGVPDPVKATMIDSTLLFLGYGLEDWDFRTLHKGLIETLTHQKKRKSFAIQKDPSDVMVSFWEKKDVRIYNIDLYEFAEQLRERCQKEGLYKEVPPTRVEG